MANDDALDELYAVPPGAFVAARDRLAGERRRAGDREGAGAIKALPKPSVSAWAAARAGRLSPEALGRLFRATDQLKRAQVGGSGARDAYQQALAAQRGAEAELAAAARQALADAGVNATPALLERVANNLKWGALGEDTRALLASGRLTKDLEPPGFGSLIEGAGPPVLTLVPAAQIDAPRRGRARDEEHEAARQAEERARRKALERELAERQRELRAAAANAEKAERRAAAARAAAEDAEEARDAARRELAAAEARLTMRAHARAEAESALAAAQEDVDRLSAAARAAEARARRLTS